MAMYIAFFNIEGYCMEADVTLKAYIIKENKILALRRSNKARSRPGARDLP